MTHTSCSDAGKAKARARRHVAAANSAERTTIPSNEGQECLNMAAVAAAKLRSWSMNRIMKGSAKGIISGAASAQRNTGAVLCLCHFNMAALQHQLAAVRQRSIGGDSVEDSRLDVPVVIADSRRVEFGEGFSVAEFIHEGVGTLRGPNRSEWKTSS